MEAFFREFTAPQLQEGIRHGFFSENQQRTVHRFLGEKPPPPAAEVENVGVRVPKKVPGRRGRPAKQPALPTDPPKAEIVVPIAPRYDLLSELICRRACIPIANHTSKRQSLKRPPKELIPFTKRNINSQNTFVSSMCDLICRSGQTPIMKAVVGGNVDKVMEYIQKGAGCTCFVFSSAADVNLGDYAGWTPLHEARDIQIATALIEVWLVKMHAYARLGRRSDLHHLFQGQRHCMKLLDMEIFLSLFCFYDMVLK